VTPLDLPIEIEVEDLGGQLAIEVVDHGPGLPAEVVAALAAGRPVLGEGGRVGLGLSIARDLARACGGSLALEPDREHGTRARLVIPAALDLEGVDP
jgi:signal transduction histidine kinase